MIEKLNEPKYYIPICFNSYKPLDEIKEYIKSNILTRYNVQLGECKHPIQIKYVYHDKVEQLSLESV